MSVTIDQIKSLREATGVSLSLCKTALENSDGNQEKAIEWMRKEGGLKAAKKADRATNEGTIAVIIEGNKAAIVKLACETDFVARNEDFISTAQHFAKEILAGKSAKDLQNEVNDAIVKVGENMQILEAEVIEGTNIGSYIHSNGKLAAIAVLSSGDEELARDICMQIVATSPQFISPEEVSEESVAKEKEIWSEQLKNEGKPEQIWDKIMMGKEKKFREENALLTQAFVKNPDQTVADILGGAKIEKMMRVSL